MPRTCGKSRRPSTCRFFCEHCGDYLSRSQYERHKDKSFKKSIETWNRGRGEVYSPPDPLTANYSSDDENMPEGNFTGKHHDHVHKVTTLETQTCHIIRDATLKNRRHFGASDYCKM